MKKRKIVLSLKCAPGDTVVLTGLLRDIALTRGDVVTIDADVHAASLLQNNPYLTPLKHLKPQKDIEYIRIAYARGIRAQRQETIHFMSYLYRDFEHKTGFAVPITLPYPDLHLSETEKTSKLVAGRYWVVVAGGKSDATVKIAHPALFEQAVAMLSAYGLQFVQMGALDKGPPKHRQPIVPGCLNMLGQTNLRQALQLIYHADGVIGPVSFCMHAAAALQKPCVVVAGGRESWWWEGYVRENAKGLGGDEVIKKLTVPHRYLHTQGMLDCCIKGGCWKNKVGQDEAPTDKNICKRPIIMPGHAIPHCMMLIEPEHVTDAVLSYYLDGTLDPPPGTQLANEIDHITVKQELQPL